MVGPKAANLLVRFGAGENCIYNQQVICFISYNLAVKSAGFHKEILIRGSDHCITVHYNKSFSLTIININSLKPNEIYSLRPIVDNDHHAAD